MDQKAANELQAERAGIAKEITPAIYQQYERVRKGRRGIAVAEVVDGRCTACQIMLRPQYFQDVKRSGIDSLLRELPAHSLLQSPAVLRRTHRLRAGRFGGTSFRADLDRAEPVAAYYDFAKLYPADAVLRHPIGPEMGEVVHPVDVELRPARDIRCHEEAHARAGMQLEVIGALHQELFSPEQPVKTLQSCWL